MCQKRLILPLSKLIPYEVMDGAQKDLEQLGVDAPLIYKRMSSIGGRGQHKGNMHRDLLVLVDCKVPTPMKVTMPFVGKTPGSWIDLPQEVFLPHELFAHLWDTNKQAFQELLSGPAGQVQQFWKAMTHNPQLQGHPLLHEQHYQDNFIPIALHGDGVPITGVGKSWSKSCDIFSWTSLLGGGRIAW